MADAHPNVELHVICDNYATHKHQNVKDWVAVDALQPDQLFLVEHGGDLLRNHHPPMLKRGTFSSVADLQDAMERYIENYNKGAKPFTWTKSAEHLLGKMKRKQIINTEH